KERHLPSRHDDGAEPPKGGQEVFSRQECPGPRLDVGAATRLEVLAHAVAQHAVEVEGKDIGSDVAGRRHVGAILPERGGEVKPRERRRVRRCAGAVEWAALVQCLSLGGYGERGSAWQCARPSSEALPAR